MEIREIYERFDDIGCLTFTTMDGEYPLSRIAHLFAYDERGLYLRTMAIKPFYHQLKASGKLALCGMSTPPQVTHDAAGMPYFPPGYTMRATGDVREVPLDEIAAKAQHDAGFKMGYDDMLRYPNERAFVLHRFWGEVYDYDYDLETRDHKLQRETFEFGGMVAPKRGMEIDQDVCIQCGNCEGACEEKKFRAAHFNDATGQYCIDRSRCDVCGSCVEVCPVDALRSLV